MRTATSKKFRTGGKKQILCCPSVSSFRRGTKKKPSEDPLVAHKLNSNATLTNNESSRPTSYFCARTPSLGNQLIRCRRDEFHLSRRRTDGITNTAEHLTSGTGELDERRTKSTSQVRGHSRPRDRKLNFALDDDDAPRAISIFRSNLLWN